MPNTSPAESLLALIAGPDRAAAILGDLTEMENRIKEHMYLFAGRLSTSEMKGDQLRLCFSALACTLVEALRRIGLKGADWAQAQVESQHL